jgi:hypothetical protein
MTMPAPQDRVEFYLKDICSVFPGAEKAVTNARQPQMRKARYWPSYTFLPMDAWERIGRQTITDDPGEMWQYHASLAALGAWQYTKGVYVFDSELFAALIDKPFDGKLPLDVLTRLPEWCIYIDTPGLKWTPLDLAGVFVHLNWNTATGATELCFAQDVGRMVEGKWEPQLETGYEIRLDDRTLRDAIMLSDFNWITFRDLQHLFKNPNRKLTKADMDLIMPRLEDFYAWQPRTKEQVERIIANRLEFSNERNIQTTEDEVRREFEKEQAKGREKQAKVEAAFNEGITLMELARLTQDDEDMTDEAMKYIGQLLSLILYICSGEADISSNVPGHYPRNPKPKKINRQLILEQPERPTIWRVGKSSGDKGHKN